MGTTNSIASDSSRNGQKIYVRPYVPHCTRVPVLYTAQVSEGEGGREGAKNESASKVVAKDAYMSKVLPTFLVLAGGGTQVRMLSG